ncbi:hypothetical protein Vretimale_2572 [Volvox reticuliferus]|nr:hypothetical protein Vretimale_2572 [Volvox reticuliferus]
MRGPTFPGNRSCRAASYCTVPRGNVDATLQLSAFPPPARVAPAATVPPTAPVAPPLAAEPTVPVVKPAAAEATHQLLQRCPLLRWQLSALVSCRYQLPPQVAQELLCVAAASSRYHD